MLPLRSGGDSASICEAYRGCRPTLLQSGGHRRRCGLRVDCAHVALPQRAAAPLRVGVAATGVVQACGGRLGSASCSPAPVPGIQGARPAWRSGGAL